MTGPMQLETAQNSMTSMAERLRVDDHKSKFLFFFYLVILSVRNEVITWNLVLLLIPL